MSLTQHTTRNNSFRPCNCAVLKHFLFYQCAFWLVLAAANSGFAQENAQNSEVSVNYAYAAQLGLGGYDVGGLTVNVYNLPFGWTFPVCVTEQPWELRVKLPLGYGHFNFEGRAADGTKLSADLDVFSLGAGLELRIPITHYWSLKPFGTFGIIKEIFSDVSSELLHVSFPFSYYYTTGLKSLFEYKWQDFTFGFGNALVYAENAAFDGSGNETYAAFETGIDVRHPLGFNIGSYEPDADLFFIYYHFLSPVTFSRFLQQPLEIKNQYEFGFTLGFAKPSKIWFLEDPRIGASYLFDSDGELNAFRINFGFPF